MKNNKKVKIVLNEKALRDIMEKEERRELEFQVDSYESYDIIMNAAEKTIDGGVIFKIQR